jgi:hypothetical protein
VAHWTRWLAAGGGVVALGVGAILVGRQRFAAAGARLVAAIDDDAAAGTVPAVDVPSAHDALPAPVRRYLAWAIPAGQRPIRRVTFTQAGDFALQPGRWTRFTATQVVTLAPRAFVWQARMPMGGIVPIDVRDAWHRGGGSMTARAAGLVTLADAHGTPDMATGALLRWLAEAAWYPVAFLPSAGAVWTPIDDSTARVTLTDAGTTVALDVTFATDGPIVRTRALRWSAADGRERPWIGRFTEWHRVDGLMIPLAGEVGWGEGADYAPYWRGRLADVRYEGAASP